MAEVPATQTWVEQLVASRLVEVQNAMSVDLRAEFEETKTRMRASLFCHRRRGLDQVRRGKCEVRP
jgi:hypothetical protein